MYPAASKNVYWLALCRKGLPASALKKKKPSQLCTRDLYVNV